MDDSESEAGVADATYQVYREDRWTGLDTFQEEGHEVRLAVVEKDRLVLLDKEHGRRLLRTGENLRYVPYSTREHKSICRHRKRKAINTAPASERLEPLLEELNANMAIMAKLMMRQWKQSVTNKKEILHKPDTSQAVTNTVVAAQLHEQASKRAVQSSNPPDEKQKERNFPNATLEGKKREFVVSPRSIQAIGKFSQKHLDVIEYKGRTTVSPNTFDNDDEYFRMLLYKLNPVVEVTRSKFVDNIIKNSAYNMTTGRELLLERFAATLGLVGVENKQFVSNILEERRQANSKTYYEPSDDVSTDSSEVSNLCIKPANTQLKQAAKRRKNTPPRKSPKRKNLSTTGFITSPSSNESSDDTVKISRTEVSGGRINPANNQIKQAAKRKNTQQAISPSSSSESSGYMLKGTAKKKVNQKSKHKANVKAHIRNTSEVDKVQKLSTSKSTTDVIEKSKHNRELRSTKVGNSHTTKAVETSSNKSTPSSPVRSPLKRPDLERVLEEDVDTVVSKQTKTKRLGEASPPKSPPTQKNKVNSSQNKSNKLDSTGNSSYVKNRTYSMLEDKIIIDYLLNERIERLVKGNLIWQQLQKCYYSLSNQSRTWQSLKNRYLKYILPKIRYYGLGYEKEKILRSGEYIGEIKKKKPAKENSIFKVQPVASASNVLRLRDKQKGIGSSQNGEPKPSTSKTDVTTKTTPNDPGSTNARPKSSKENVALASSTPNKKQKIANPTYSELTRKFKERRQALMVSSSDSDSSKEFRSPTRAATRKLFNAKVFDEDCMLNKENHDCIRAIKKNVFEHS